MTIHYLPSADPSPSVDMTARELVFLAGPNDDLLLPDDDVFDRLAVETAAEGRRLLRLTIAERLAAASRILASGASVRNVCLRLGLPEATERKWEQLHSRISAIGAVVVMTAIAFSNSIFQIGSPMLISQIEVMTCWTGRSLPTMNR